MHRLSSRPLLKVKTETLLAWTQHKAQARNGLRRICNTLKEYRSLQRSDAPRELAVQSAMPAGRLRRPLMSGDTIIEVMISMTVLGLVIGTAFVTTRRSLQAGLQAGYRDQAHSYAQQQVELLKEIDDKSRIVSGGFTGSGAFCVDPATQNRVNIGSLRNTCIFPGVSAPPESRYYSDVSYDDTKKVYTIQVTWPSSSAGNNSVSVFYKPHNSHIDCGSCYPPPTAGPPPAPSSFLTFTSDWTGTGGPTTPQVPQNTVLHLTWSSSPGTANCSGTGGTGSWAGTGKPANMTPPGFTTSPLTASVTFTLTCFDSAGNPGPTKNINVTVSTPPPVINSLTNSPAGSVPYNGNTTIVWSSSNTNGCTLNGAGVAPSGSQPFGPLTANPTVFTLVCSGSGGPDVTRTLNVSVDPPPPPPGPGFDYIFFEPLHINAGGSSTLKWGTRGMVACYLYGTIGVPTTGTQLMGPFASTTSVYFSCYDATNTWYAANPTVFVP